MVLLVLRHPLLWLAQWKAKASAILPEVLLVVHRLTTRVTVCVVSLGVLPMTCSSNAWWNSMLELGVALMAMVSRAMLVLEVSDLTSLDYEVMHELLMLLLVRSVFRGRYDRSSEHLLARERCIR